MSAALLETVLPNCPDCGAGHAACGGVCDCCTSIAVAPPLMPFFTYYGGKFRAAKHYPPPTHDMVIEPFAGSGGYSLRYNAFGVWLNDIDPVIVGTWRYLQGASEADILNLPDLKPGQTVDDLSVPQEARWLIGWWLNKGSAQPKKRASTFMLHHAAGAPYWGESIRRRIAGQIEAIRHWRVTELDYRELPDVGATWFIDPPYMGAGHHYRFGSRGIDYAELADWCRVRRGQVVACEADEAAWLPFRPLIEIDGTEGRQKKSRARLETIWTAP